MSESGWALSGASVGSGVETFLGGASHPVTIDGGGSATTPSLCFNQTMPFFRFFARQLTPDGSLTVEAFPVGPWSPVEVTELSNGSMPAWSPSARISLLSGELPAGMSVDAALRFEVSGGAWQIDDVYVDPYRSN